MRFTHKGYTLEQDVKNSYDYTIFDENGKKLWEIPYNKPMTEEKAKESIEHAIYLVKNGLSFAFSC